MSPKTQERSNLDKQIEDYYLRLSDWPMAYDVIFYGEDFVLLVFCVGGKREQAYNFKI